MMRKLATMTAVTVLTATVGFGGAAWAANTTVNFDGVAAPVSGAALDTFLAGVGITLTNVTGAGSLVVISAATLGGPLNVVAPSQPNVIEQNGGVAVSSYTFVFDTPLDSFSFTRAGYCTPLAFPSWTMVAKDSFGTTLATVGEGSGGTGASCFAPTASAAFNFATPGIKSVTINSGNFGFFGRSGPAFDDFVLSLSVGIDIKPGSDPNSINLCGVGVVPAAILGSATFDVTNVDLGTVMLAGAGVKMVGKPTDPKVQCSVEDVNVDSFDDLVCKFLTVDLALTGGDADATVVGDTLGGIAFDGTDTVNIVKDCP